MYSGTVDSFHAATLHKKYSSIINGRNLNDDSFFVITGGTRSGLFPQWANYVVVGIVCFLIGFPLGVFSLGFYIRKGNQKKKYKLVFEFVKRLPID